MRKCETAYGARQSDRCVDRHRVGCIEHGCDVIAFEELTDIRERLSQAKWHHV